MSTQLTDVESIQQILKEMTIEEKLYLLTGSTSFEGGKCDKYGIPAPLMLDGGTGFNTSQAMHNAVFRANEVIHGASDPESMSGPLDAFNVSVFLRAKMAHGYAPESDLAQINSLAQSFLDERKPQKGRVGCFPPGIMLGATMNPEAVRLCGEAVGREASACGIDVLLGSPNVNIQRDPKGGRLFEGYSEDPYVVSLLAPEFVKGVQSTGVMANVKHFAANNQETDRMGLDEIIDERALREIYLPGFKACVEAGCKTVMTAYNRINGVACAENPWLLRHVLREEWDFKGFVVSDWGAVYDRVKSLKAGNDLTMPGPREIGSLLDAAKSGYLTLDEIDTACGDYLKVLLEMPVMRGQRYPEIDEDFSMDAAYCAAKEGITLLKNDGVLPLGVNTKIAFYGEKSREFYTCGTGSAAVLTERNTSLMEAAASLNKNRVSFGKADVDTDAIVVTVGANGGEAVDRMDMTMDEDDKGTLEAAIKDAGEKHCPVILILNVAAPIDLTAYVDRVDAIVCVYLPGMAGGKACADVLFGIINPSGKLPVTFPKQYMDTPTALNFPGEYQRVTYGEGIYVGYRYYDKKNIEPLFPFGHGLSYTTFELGNLELPAAVEIDREVLLLSLNIINTGERAGAETIQLYLQDVDSRLHRPLKELKGVRKMYLEPGESRRVVFELDKEAFCYFDPRLGRFVAEPGKFQVLIGTSSRNIQLAAYTEIICQNPYALSGKTEIAALMAQPRALKIIEKYLPELDLLTVAGMYIIFLPFTPFEEVWQRSIVPELKEYSEAEKSQIYRCIIEEL